MVAVFGRSGLDAGGCKAGAVEAMVGQQIFSRDLTTPIDIDQSVLVSNWVYFLVIYCMLVFFVCVF